MKRHAGYLTLFSVFSLVFILTLIFVPSTFALRFSTTQTMDFTFNPALNLTLSSNELNINNLSSGSPGVSNAITIDVETNTSSRLLLNATVGSSANATTSLVHNQFSSYKFDSIATNASVAELSSSSNTWGYATYDNDEGSSWSNYSGLPLYSATPKALINDNSVAPKSHSLDFRISAAANSTQPAGVYTNQINFAAVAEPVVYTYGIWWRPGGNLRDSDVSNMPANEVGVTSLTPNVTITIPSNIPVASGHTFNGWCTASNVLSGGCSGQLLQPGDSYEFTITGSSYTVLLFGTWDQSTTTFDSAFAAAGKSKYRNYYKMQDMTHSICSAISTNQESQLIDSRDNKIYYVAKLADGNCWMTQNLDHDISSNYAYNDVNTDVPSNWDEELESTHSNTVWEGLDDTSESYNIGDYCWNEEFGEDGGMTSCSQSGNHYHLGNYYNWTAAVASEDSSVFEDEIVDQSICPAGWTLPSRGHFKGLMNVYGNDDYDVWVESPLYFTFGDAWAGSLINGIGYNGLYWSSYAESSDDMKASNFVLDYDSSEMFIAPEMRSLGLSIRCIAR